MCWGMGVKVFSGACVSVPVVASVDCNLDTRVDIDGEGGTAPSAGRESGSLRFNPASHQEENIESGDVMGEMGCNDMIVGARIVLALDGGVNKRPSDVAGINGGEGMAPGTGLRRLEMESCGMRESSVSAGVWSLAVLPSASPFLSRTGFEGSTAEMVSLRLELVLVMSLGMDVARE